MKNNSIIVVFIALMLSVSLCKHKLSTKYSFQDFCQEFQLDYTEEQKQYRRKIFQENYRKLLIQSENGKDVKAQPFLDWTQQQLDEFFGFRPKDDGQNHNPPMLSSSGITSLPSAFDWRDTQKVSPIKNQGSCGSCWAFGAAAQIESKFLIEKNTLYDLSEQYFVQCQTKLAWGCNGGWPDESMKLFSRTGMPTEQNLPYKAKDTYYNQSEICVPDGQNKTSKTENYTRLDSIKGVYIYKNSSVEQMKRLLVDHGPYSVTVAAGHDGFKYPANGYIQCGNRTALDHVVVLVGYTSTYWIIKNSWTKRWGNLGYGYIPIYQTAQGDGDCGIRQYAYIMQTLESDHNPQEVLTISMFSSSSSYGWSGTVLGIKQNNKIIDTFGSSFNIGTSTEDVKIPVKQGELAQVVVTQFGISRYVGFTIKDSHGTVIQNFQTNHYFTSNAVLGNICLNCPQTLNLKYRFYLYDTYGDGWNGNILYIERPNGTKTSFGAQFNSGRGYGPIQFQFELNDEIQIGAQTFGSYRTEVGFKVYDHYNNLVGEFVAGSAGYYSLSQILFDFCVECVNNLPNNVYQPSNLKTEEETSTLQSSESSINNNNNVEKGIVVALICLSIAVLVLSGIIVVFIVRNRKTTTKQLQYQANLTAASSTDIIRQAGMRT